MSRRILFFLTAAVLILLPFCPAMACEHYDTGQVTGSQLVRRGYTAPQVGVPGYSGDHCCPIRRQGTPRPRTPGRSRNPGGSARFRSGNEQTLRHRQARRDKETRRDEEALRHQETFRHKTERGEGNGSSRRAGAHGLFLRLSLPPGTDDAGGRHPGGIRRGTGTVRHTVAFPVAVRQLMISPPF